MKRLLPVSSVVVLSLIIPAAAISQTPPVDPHPSLIASDLKPPELNSSFIPDDPSIPVEMLDVMRISEFHYHEGSDLLKSGQSAKARAAFNVAVDTILKSVWDLQSTPVLNKYFQDLIQRIQKDESRYLRPNEEAEEAPEPAVVDELESLDLIPINVDPSLRDVVQADLVHTRYDIPV